MNSNPSYDGIPIEEIVDDIKTGYGEAKDPDVPKTISLSGRDQGLVKLVAGSLVIPGTRVVFNGSGDSGLFYRVDLDAVVSLLASAKQRFK